MVLYQLHAQIVVFVSLKTKKNPDVFEQVIITIDDNRYLIEAICDDGTWPPHGKLWLLNTVLLAQLVCNYKIG